MNAFTMPAVSDMGMMWLDQTPTSQDLSLDLAANDAGGGDLLDQDSPYYLSSHTSISNQSLDDDISNMTMDGMDFVPYTENKQESSDCSYVDDDAASVSMITTSTQTTGTCLTRKIKPIRHPGLVLKTPIAYESNTDPSVIPIQKDGIAICERCGAIGVKHAFYTKERRFCSMTCARSYNGYLAESLSQTEDSIQDEIPLPQDIPPEEKQYMSHRFRFAADDDFTGFLLDQPFPQLPPPPPPISTPPLPQPPSIPNSSFRRKSAKPANSAPFEWDSYLKDANFIAAPVSCFKHAPLSDIWDNILVGMKVEVENTDCGSSSEAFSDSFWVATVIRVLGYKVLLRYEGYGLDDSKDFWVLICSTQVHSVGWCATRGKPLIPPKSIQDKYSDWKKFLCDRLTGARTLPSNFSYKIAESMKSRFHCGLNLEVVNKDRISQVKLASIDKIVGKRLLLKYFDSQDSGFWVHEDSPLIHPIGWSHKVGHSIVAPPEYLFRVNEKEQHENDARINMFKHIQIGSPDDSETEAFLVGMKLEAIDPLNLVSICAATVMNVLHCGYLMIRIDSFDPDATGGDWFCYHVTSPCIFPVGFCKENDIALSPPRGYENDNFAWEEFLNITNCIPITKDLLDHPIPQHGFVEGMKLEAADLMDPKLICPANIDRITAHLIKVNFDGWDHDFDQWLDIENCNIYPVGWANSVNYVLAGPRLPTSPKMPKKRGRKKKKDVSPPKLKDSETEPQIEVKLEIIEDTANRVEPEINLEPASFTQNTSPLLNPPLERKATSYINAHENTNTKAIPKLMDDNEPLEGNICPEEWNVFDVAQFLRINDCVKYCDVFCKNKIDGRTFLGLTNPEVLNFTSGIVGPSVKIFNLIQQLKEKTNPIQSRLRSKSKKKLL